MSLCCCCWLKGGAKITSLSEARAPLSGGQKPNQNYHTTAQGTGAPTKSMSRNGSQGSLKGGTLLTDSEIRTLFRNFINSNTLQLQGTPRQNGKAEIVALWSKPPNSKNNANQAKFKLSERDISVYQNQKGSLLTITYTGSRSNASAQITVSVQLCTGLKSKRFQEPAQSTEFFDVSQTDRKGLLWSTGHKEFSSFQLIPV